VFLRKNGRKNEGLRFFLNFSEAGATTRTGLYSGQRRGKEKETNRHGALAHTGFTSI
jgi:hypothetical protein